jgi:transposase
VGGNDDSVADGRAGVACDRLHRHAVPSLALQVQEILHRDPLSGHLFCFRGRRGNLLKVIWHDSQGVCLFTKRLDGLRHGDDLVRAVRLSAVRHRLATSAGDVAADIGGMTVFAL